MGIGSIPSTSSMSVMQMTPTDLKDQKSKSIQNEITDVQQQMQKLSSKEELSANEKANERKKLQKEISGLNTELKQHQEELLRSQKREQMLAELREDINPAKEDDEDVKVQSDEASSKTSDAKNPSSDEQQTAQPGDVIARNSDGTVILKEALNQSPTPAIDTEQKQAVESNEEAVDGKEAEDSEDDTVADADSSGKQLHAMMTADSSLNQASRAGVIVTRTSDGIAILKGEIRQDELRDPEADMKRKQAELDKMEQQEQRAMAFQFSILGEANNAMKPTAETISSAKGNPQVDAETNAYINALNLSLEEQTSQPKFFVSFG